MYKIEKIDIKCTHGWRNRIPFKPLFEGDFEYEYVIRVMVCCILRNGEKTITVNEPQIVKVTEIDGGIDGAFVIPSGTWIPKYKTQKITNNWYEKCAKEHVEEAVKEYMFYVNNIKEKK